MAEYMTHRERAAAALEYKIPDRIPHFEIEYQLAGQMFGKDFLRSRELEGLSHSLCILRRPEGDSH